MVLRLLRTALVISGIIALSLLAAEFMAQVFVTIALKHGKLYEPDQELGWVPLPNLFVVRRNANGDEYPVRTNQDSIRGNGRFPDDPTVRRLLVLDDSFAFGEGVKIEDRFDNQIIAELKRIAIVDLGVPGYGTDQEIIRAQHYLMQLRRDDAVLILFYGNDFADVARTGLAGRPKPYFSLDKGRLVEHPPRIGWWEDLRDRSYIASIYATAMGERSDYQIRLPQVPDLLAEMIRAFAGSLAERGVHLWIAHHGIDVFPMPFDRRAAMARICRLVTRCIDLDPVLNGKPHVFLKDGHWTAMGHRIVGARLAQSLSIAIGEKR